MGEIIKRNSHWVAIFGTLVMLTLACITAVKAYGALDNQVEVNADAIKTVQNDLKGYPNRFEFETMQKQVQDIHDYFYKSK